MNDIDQFMHNLKPLDISEFEAELIKKEATKLGVCGVVFFTFLQNHYWNNGLSQDKIPIELTMQTIKKQVEHIQKIAGYKDLKVTRVTKH